MREAPWYLLVHQLPAKPLYLRARIRQLLARAGAVAIKNSVYVLPRAESSRAALERIAAEAAAGGGEAHLSTADFLPEAANEEVAARFRRERGADYEALAAELRELDRRRRRPGGAAADEEIGAQLRRLGKRLGELAAIDFFAAPERAEAERLAQGLAERLEAPAGPRRDRPERSPLAAELAGRVWVTRRGVHVDRIASAWLVRRFVDPEARFRFVDGGSPPPAPGEVRFDTVGGDFTHEGDRCTFETLLARLDLGDPALAQIAEIVHDIDIADGKFGRADAAGISRLLTGLVLSHPDDRDRLERGFALFDDLYESFRRRPAATPRQAAPPRAHPTRRKP